MPDNAGGHSGPICLVTHRNRLLSALERAASDWMPALLAQIEGAIAGGVDVVQIREADLDAGALAVLVRKALDLASGTAVRILVNDRLDVAIATNADGVHLPERSLPSRAARQILRQGMTLGRSVHGVEALADCAADYVIAGSVFATLSKVGQPATLGLEGLRRIVAAAGNCPVWAIGGITEERVPLVRAQGASGIAVIGALMPEVPTEHVARFVRKRAEILRNAFDSSSGLP